MHIVTYYVHVFIFSGQVESHARSTVSNAIAAKISEVDIYMYPSLRKSASLQVNEMVDNMTGIPYGKIWLDIEVKQSFGSIIQFLYFKSSMNVLFV